MAIVDWIRTSLRARLMVSMGIVLLTFLALALGSYSASRTMIDALEQVVRTETSKLKPIIDLQRLIQQIAMPPNDYLITGSGSERLEFERLAPEADARFDAITVSRVFMDRRGLALLQQARAEWEEARRTGADILAMADPIGSAEGGLRMKVFDSQVGLAVESLNRLYAVALGEIGEQETRARAVRRREMALLVLMFTVALAIVAIAGIVLSRSVVIPFRALQDGIFRFSQGDHSFRVVLDRADEFGKIAQTLNLMADRLQHDGLTGAYSRYELHRLLRNEIERSRRYGRPFALLMVDIDRFKEVNDAHGHACGDDALRAVARRLREALRSVDGVARYGGEEFAIVMPETEAQGAGLVADRLRGAVANEPVETARGPSISITVSIGVAAFPADARSEDDLIAAADQALYAAKRLGRNRVVVHRPAMNAQVAPADGPPAGSVVGRT